MNENDQKLLENIATIIERIGVPFLSKIANFDPIRLSTLFSDDKDLENLAIQIYRENIIDNLANRLARENTIDELIMSGEIRTTETPDNLLNVIRPFVKECATTGKLDGLSIFHPLLNSLNKNHQSIPFVTDELSDKIETALKTALNENKLTYEDINFDLTYTRKRLFLKGALSMEKDGKYKIFLKKYRSNNGNESVNDFVNEKTSTEEINNDNQPEWIRVATLLLLAFIGMAGARLISANW